MKDKPELTPCEFEMYARAILEKEFCAKDLSKIQNKSHGDLIKGYP